MTMIRHVICKQCNGQGYISMTRINENNAQTIEKSACEHCGGSGKDVIFIRKH